MAETITGMGAPVGAGRGWLDRLAIGVSALCLVHCVSTAVLAALIASAGGVLGSPLIHEAGLALAFALATIAIGRGIVMHGHMMPGAVGGLGLGVMAGAIGVPHGADEMIYTILGVALVALGHDLNRRALI